MSSLEWKEKQKQQRWCIFWAIKHRETLGLWTKAKKKVTNHDFGIILNVIVSTHWRCDTNTSKIKSNTSTKKKLEWDNFDQKKTFILFKQELNGSHPQFSMNLYLIKRNFLINRSCKTELSDLSTAIRSICV